MCQSLRHLIYYTLQMFKRRCSSLQGNPVVFTGNQIPSCSDAATGVSVNLIPTRGAYYTHCITACPSRFENLTESLLQVPATVQSLTIALVFELFYT